MHAHTMRERELQFQPDNEGMKHFQTNHHEGLHTHQLVLSGHVASPAKEFVRSANGKILKSEDFRDNLQQANKQFHSYGKIIPVCWISCLGVRTT